MLIFPPPKEFRRRRKRSKRPATNPTPPPAALVLVAASFSTGDGAIMRLTFDRAIDVGNVDTSQIVLRDGMFLHQQLVGNEVTVVDPTTIDLSMMATGPTGIAVQLLTASAMTGIVAVDNGGTWPGITNAELPIG
jgi:hypothetical protein